MKLRRRRIGKKQHRFRKPLRSVVAGCALGLMGLMPLKADARLPDISALSFENKKPGQSSISASDPAQEPAEKGESGFRSLERSELSIDLRLGRIKGHDISLVPFGYSWRLQGIPYGGGLMVRLDRSVLGGEWNGRDGGLLILGYDASFAGKRLEVMPRLYIAPQHPGIGGRLRIGFRINKQIMIYSDSYLMSSRSGQADSMNLMVGFSFGR